MKLYVIRKLVPLIQKGKDTIASKKGVGYQKLLDQSVVQLKETVKVIHIIIVTPEYCPWFGITINNLYPFMTKHQT